MLDKLRDLRLILSKLAEILGEFAATERRELEVDTSREVSSETFCCDQERAISSKVGDKPEKFRLYTTNRSFELCRRDQFHVV